MAPTEFAKTFEKNDRKTDAKTGSINGARSIYPIILR
jgi:hypothetical protein